jgi:hypothetical protein
MTVKFSHFGGLYPVGYWALNAPNIADVAIDVDLGVGTVKPWRTDDFVSGVLGAQALYEVLGCCVLSDPSPCTKYAEGDPSPTCDETVYRTRPGTKPQVATTTGACTGEWRDMSFPNFTAPAVVAPAVPADDRMEQLYAEYTVVDDWGRESAPSAVSIEFYANFGTTLLVSGFPTTYPNGSKIKIYISRAAWASGNEQQPIEEHSSFYLAAEFPIGPASMLVTLGMPGPANITYDYEPAPNDLWDITSFRGGQLLGLSGNAVHASIKHVFHAWPRRFLVRFYGQARRLIAGRQIAYVLTDEAPLMMRIPAGCNEASCFQSQQLATPLPIASAQSAAMFGDTVIYATYDGLVALTGQEHKYFPHWSKADWQKLRPDTMIGEVHDNAYFFTSAGGTFRLGLQEDGLKALTQLSEDKVLALHESSYGRLLMSTPSGVVAWNRGPGYKVAKWERHRAHRGPLRAASVVDIVATGSHQVTLKQGGLDFHTVSNSGDNQGRICVARGRDFGVKISTSGEVAQVIIGPSITQVNHI